MIRTAALLLAAITLHAPPSVAEPGACPFPADQPFLVVQLFFGQTTQGGHRVTPGEWTSFLRRVVTPAFPDGFTVYDASGQWLDRARHHLVREPSKVIELAVADAEPARAAIASVIDGYKRQFRQQTVGMISNLSCGNFSP